MKTYAPIPTVSLAAAAPSTTNTDHRIISILEAYQESLENGHEPDPESLIAEHPDLAERLRTSIESLRLMYRAACGFEPVEDPSSSESFVPKQLGDFEIFGEIGRGGMGVVYEARQISLDRRVALKVLPFAAMLDSRQIARFTNEARAAAQLHHPHIVPVYAVGCERGVHFYAMQFVDGQPLDAAIEELDRARRPEATRDSAATAVAESTQDGRGQKTWPGLSTAIGRRDTHFRQAAALMAQAADALQHAHEFGVIHRDIKPSNLLLDREGKIWVTDFGLARCQRQDNLTATGDLLGTFRYMSPEQAAGNTAYLDERTDVYGLGITLYELLTLHPAFPGQQSQDLLARIAHDEPRPLRQINPSIPYDLETIVLKAVSKSREDRYMSAQEMADDLRCYLDGKPTVARRPSALVRLSKWARRHQAAMTVTALVMAVALAGLTVAMVLIAREKSRTDEALAESRRNLRTAEENRLQAEKYFRQARDAVDRLGLGHAQQLASMPGAEPLRQSLLRATLGYYEDFLGQAEHDDALQTDTAITHFKVAGITEQIGEARAAIVSYERARALFTELASRTPEDREHRRRLALCENNLGLLRNRMGNSEAAIANLQKAVKLHSLLLKDSPDNADTSNELALAYGNLALVYGQSGDLARAETAYDAAITLQESLLEHSPASHDVRAALATSYNNLSYSLAVAAPNRAEQYARKALRLQQDLATSFPNSLDHLANQALSLNNLGSLAMRLQRHADARNSYEQALQIQRQLCRKAPAVHRFRADLAIATNNLAQICSKLGDAPAARTAFDEAQQVLEELLADYPQELEYQSSLAGVHNNRAMVLEQDGDLDGAIAAYRVAIQLQGAAHEAAPTMSTFRDFLNKHYVNCGRVLRSAGRFNEALEISQARLLLWSGDSEQLYLVAADMAAAVVEDDKLQATWVETVAVAIEKAAEAGFADFERLKRDPKFASVIDNLSFRKRLESLQTATKGE
ncbi:MAG: protein kinase [Planctomycetales bacterium]|nr:protein kinase [Planctomycetales bacterium]